MLPTAHLAIALALFPMLSCSPSSRPERLGSLTLALTAEAGGAEYKLRDARFSLEGPEARALSDQDEETLTVEVLAGTYTLSLLDGWSLERVEGDAAPVGARLVSENPMTVVVAPGGTSSAVFRFELDDGTSLGMATGTLHIALGVDPLDTDFDAGSNGSVCSDDLRVSEVDYEQPGADEGEFVELVNPGTCAASLENVTLELVNGGGDGSVYARYDLGTSASELGPKERLLLADEALLATLTPTGPFLPLNAAGLQNGPDALRLVRGERVLDEVAYGGALPLAGEGEPSEDDLGEGSLARCPDAVDPNVDALDLRITPPTPGAPNACLGAQR